jgi:LacI family transcriptional regulator
MLQKSGRKNNMPSASRSSKDVTIADIAATAGVATSTVSRALSNPDLVNERTRLHIESIAKQLEYRQPSPRRTTLSGTRNIAIVVPDISNPFFAKLVRGTHHRVSGAGYTQILIDTEESPKAELDSILKISESVDGLILAASRITDAELLEISNQKPVVAINRDVEGVSSVQIDTADGATQAVEHLISLGHRKIAYVSGPVTSWSNQRRWAAIVEACARFNVEPIQTSPFVPNFTTGQAAADAVLNTGATAAICFNDPLAIGILERLSARGIRVPEEFSVIGCDNSFGSQFCNPPLTTISSATENAGKKAVDALIALIEGDSIPGGVVAIPTFLKLRRSTSSLTEEQ